MKTPERVGRQWPFVALIAIMIFGLYLWPEGGPTPTEILLTVEAVQKEYAQATTIVPTPTPTNWATRTPSPLDNVTDRGILIVRVATNVPTATIVTLRENVVGESCQQGEVCYWPTNTPRPPEVLTMGEGRFLVNTPTPLPTCGASPPVDRTKPCEGS